MNRDRPLSRCLLGGILAALLPVLGTAVPLLDGGGSAHRTVLEAQHEPGTCPTGHDHTICTQVGANLAAPAPSPDAARPFAVHQLPATAEAVPNHPSALLGPPSRAPPAA